MTFYVTYVRERTWVSVFPQVPEWSGKIMSGLRDRHVRGPLKNGQDMAPPYKRGANVRLRTAIVKSDGARWLIRKFGAVIFQASRRRQASSIRRAWRSRFAMSAFVAALPRSCHWHTCTSS